MKREIEAKAGKKRFIKNVLKGMQESMLDSIDRMPPEWDGFELRWLIADVAKYHTMPMGGVDKKRHRAYNNTRMVKNI